jgi:DNA-binding NtrC family response regulator
LAVLSGDGERQLVTTFARDNGWNVSFAETVEQARTRLAGNVVAVILLDRDSAGVVWRSMARNLADHRPAPCIILMSSVVDRYLFQELVNQGGYDIVAKPLRPEELRRIVGLAFAFWKSRVVREGIT